MLVGEFLERGNDIHCDRRSALLEAASPLPDLLVELFGTDRVEPDDANRVAVAQLAEHGLAAIQLTRPLTDDEYVGFGSALGTVIPETDPATLARTSHGTILNLRSTDVRTDDVALQPFATNPLSLHSESSGRAVAEQPRYIVLMCMDPGEDDAAPRTVLVSMGTVAARLSADDLDRLARTRYRDAPGVPPIARRLADRYVFSFRDFQGTPLKWVAEAPEPTETDMADTLRRLLAAMYASTGALAVRWTPGLLVVIDNTAYFHGRTAGTECPTRRPRHLKRLRIR